MKRPVPGPVAGGIEGRLWMSALVALGLLIPGGAPCAAEEVLRPEPTRTIVAEWALAEVRTAQDRAEALAKDGRYEDAAELLGVVRQNLMARSLDRQAPVATALAAVELRQNELRALAISQGANRRTAERTKALETARTGAGDQDRILERRRAERLRRIYDLRDRGFLDEALAQCRVLRAELVDDREDPEIRRLFAELQDAVHEHHRLGIAERQIELQQEIRERITRDLLPTGHEGLPLYAPDWASRRGVAQGVRLTGIENEEPWRAQLKVVLASRIDIVADQQGAIELLKSLAVRTGLNLVIDSAIIAAADKPVSLKVSSIRLENALSWITQLMGTRWHLSKGAVVIGGAVDQEIILAIHDVGALVNQTVDHPGRNLGTTLDQNGTKVVEVTTDQTKALTPEEIADLIKKSIGPGSWDAPGRGITIRGTTLFISAPRDLQQMIGEFLHSQENSHNLQVRIDTRWLEVTDNFMEEVGVQWTTSNSLVRIPGLIKGVQKVGGSFQLEGGTNTPLPATVYQKPSSSPGNSPGLTVSVGVLPGGGVSAILTAVERAGQGRTVQGPSLTTLNGVRSSVFQGQLGSYVSSYNVTDRNLDPVISNITTGLVLDIKPQVSADRKYVTMEFKPAVTTARFYTEYIIAFRNMPIGAGGGEGANANTDYLLLIPSLYPLELPNITLRQAAVTIALPDRASAVIGGLGKAVDESTNTQVPILGTIPFLGRLFGTRGRYSDHGQLYLLATVTIIPYDELETTL